MVQPIIER